DPRAGQGPGIGGMKQDSEIGEVLRAGHPCYFVGFLENPMPGQTVEDVCRAEARFVAKVAELHPEAEGKPCLIGNCQAGWQIIMMSAICPDVVGPVMVAGAPLSYWAGVHGGSPMRYLGGLLGGTWLTALSGDLGNGRFDSAYLVGNFESLKPSNTYWTKLYSLYSKVDTEAPRFLEFEKWWGNLILLNAEEMQWISDQLFVGNKLSSGELRTSDGVRVDLRNIRSPIVVFNLGLYRTFLGPAVRNVVTEHSANLMRHLHPSRMRFEMFSDKNPLMRPVAAWADSTRAQRKPASADNPLLKLQQETSDQIVEFLDAFAE